MSAPSDPLSTYRQLRAGRQRGEATLTKQADWLSHARLTTFIAGLVMAWMATIGGELPIWWLAVPVTLFIGLVVRHNSTLLAREQVRRAVAWYDHGIARLEDRWSGIGIDGNEFADTDHLFSQDLDLFGEGSLFQLLNTAQTRFGEQILASWLLTPADYSEVKSRQEAVRDLQPQLALREQIATTGYDRRTTLHPVALAEWAATPAVLDGTLARIGAFLFTLLTLTSTAAWFVGVATALPMVLALCASAVYARYFQHRSEQIMHAAAGPARELMVVGRICQVLRGTNYTSDRLSSLCESLETPDGAVQQLVRRLEQIVQRHDWQHNIIFTPIAYFLFWQTHCALSVETWRPRYGDAVAKWLKQVGEFEALSAMSAYAYEHPTDPYPKLASSSETATYDAVGLAHPLIPAAQAIRNDVKLGPQPRIMIISGSNMSGKTTLLRSVGVSTVMALMGAPVRAKRLFISPVVLGATLRIEDSLQAGHSRFYAEVLRLGQIVTTARSTPVLVLLDELFHGTNSHDRTDGAHGLLRSLISLGAIGFVTTHDLALTRIGDRLEPQTRNMHFDDTLVGNEMRFDYRLKPGPVRRSNALAIMRAVGLDVSSTDQT